MDSSDYDSTSNKIKTAGLSISCHDPILQQLTGRWPLASGGHMVLTDGLIQKGFTLQTVSDDDLETYINIKRACCKKYVDEYNGGWLDEIQVIIITNNFHKMQTCSCFQKILLCDTIVGFFTYDEQPDKIAELSFHLMGSVQSKEMVTFYLSHVTSLSKAADKPVFLILYKSDPIQDMFKEFGFKIYDQSRTHYFMSFHPNEENEIDHRNHIRSYVDRICSS